MADLPNLFYVQLQEQCDGVTWVKVTRCKDCKHWAWPNTCCLETITRYEDDYCSRVERREDNAE